jgi:flavodoxin
MLVYGAMSRISRVLRGLTIVVGALAVLLVGLVLSMGVAGEDALRPPAELRMPTSNILVIYYSRSGTTQKLAEAIARPLGADTERIVDTVHREGFFGFMRALKDAFKKGASPIQPLGVDPAAYELVIIGTPDWGQSVAAPTRTFLASQKGRLPNVAFFLTDGTSDHAKVFQDMMELVGAKPVATLGIPHAEVVNDRFALQVEEFLRRLPRPATRQSGAM